jgi:hypothetical protein
VTRLQKMLVSDGMLKRDGLLAPEELARRVGAG